MMKICIIGAGVSGIACAIKILEHYQLKHGPESIQVKVISEDFTPNTTGDGSAGLWGPYLLGGTPTEKVYTWSKSMHMFLQELWLSPDAGEAGVCLIPCVRLTTSPGCKVDDFWRDIVYGAVDLTPDQLEVYSEGRKEKYTAGLSFMTFTSEPVKLLPYLMKRFTKAGGRIIQGKIIDFNDFIRSSKENVIINCTGLGSRTLLQDKQMDAVRGQVSRVKADWIFHAILDESDDSNYVIPNTESVVLGGTHQMADYNTQVCPRDKDFIVNGCRNLIPGLTHAQHLYDWVGLRPGRTTLRLEALQVGDKLVIHNYGHGGSGVTLAWGCADEVLELLEKHRGQPVSKL